METVGWVTFGSGLFSFAAGGVLAYMGYLQAEAARDTLQRTNGGPIAPTTRNDAQAFATGGLVLMGTGLLATAVGATFVILAHRNPSASLALGVTPERVMLGGTF